jgi:anti-sigma B factor antagonist
VTVEIEEFAVDKDVLLIVFKGSLTSRHAKEVKAVFNSVAVRKIPYVIADLTEVPFMDSSGLMEIIVGHKLLKEQGGALKLVVPVPQVRLVLELTMAEKFLSIYYDREEALNSVPRL